MSRSATLPPIRVAPETKASLEAVLREGESLTQFIENAVCREAEFRTEQNAAVARAKKALRSADKGANLLTVESFLAGMEQRAKAGQQRIREAVMAKNKRTGG
ncbi:MAG TPA: YlcI/YnfO family protein [Burkholderiaceae bacterium]|nr:YlcI/YnfO family protein [Burkholderiaceae bacterium]